ncbi:unnamed protein product [Rotaria socialis]|uniref:Uncharacterized protein n=1 Tax=Rotaria socialis TaxID=392032 RepID=A0A818STX1_9BILA|nr:unnamed protein product [Rotaria socialis]
MYYACEFIVHHVLKPFFRGLFKCLYFFHINVLLPVGKFLIYMVPIIRRNIKLFGLDPIQRVAFQLDYFAYESILKPCGQALSKTLPMFVTTCTAIAEIVANSINTIAGAISITSNAIVSAMQSIHVSNQSS